MRPFGAGNGGEFGWADMKLESRTSTLQDLYADESARIQKNFDESGDGKAAISERTSLIDSVVKQLWNEVTGPGEPISGFCIAAMGGYGRRALFPYSDIDLLFLYEKEGREEFLSRKIIAPLSQALWDLHLRVSPTTTHSDNPSDLRGRYDARSLLGARKGTEYCGSHWSDHRCD